ncbi:MAG: aminotransferase class III-fold pyridoxal phosphate-dependent enzyme, partial [Comamonas sp.]
GGLGGTYAGHPLAVAAALAVIDVMQAEQLPARAQLLGEKLMQALRALQARVPELAEVRGLGAMVAAEFKDPATGAPLAARVKRIQELALERGLLLLTCGVHANVIRFLFPLTIEEEVFEEGLAILAEAIAPA